MKKMLKSLCDDKNSESQPRTGKNPLTFVTQDSAFKDTVFSRNLNIIVKSDVHGSCRGN